MAEAQREAIEKTLKAHGQEHLLAYYDELDEARRRELLDQVREIDFDRIDELIQTHVLQAPQTTIPRDIRPPQIWPAIPADAQRRREYDEARQAGERLIRDGKVAAFVVAGGQGTRLGISGPKGALDVTPVRGKSLFQVFAEQLLATERRFGRAVPWYIMTSPLNDRQTREFFAEHGFFGLSRENVMFFPQGTMPAIGFDGRLLLASKHSLALSPDGHGGSLTALRRSGALDDMRRRGVEHISYFQVDNPLVRCVDPVFLGLHARQGAQMSAKALPKRDAMEKLGNFCEVDGRVVVIEYSDLPESLARATGPDGRLLFWAGSIAIHVLSRRFVETLTEGGRCQLPFHRAEKKVAHVGADGQVVEPGRPNAVKLEMFVFDALPMAEAAVVLETSRPEEFSPVKNASGADSLQTSQRDQVRRAAAWLESAGVAVPRDAAGEVACTVEISPLLALDAAELSERLKGRTVDLAPGRAAYLE